MKLFPPSTVYCQLPWASIDTTGITASASLPCVSVSVVPLVSFRV